MRPPIPITIAIGLSLVTHAIMCRAVTEPKHFEASAPRTITVSEEDAPPVVRAGLLQSTLFVLPPEEKVMKVFGGDTNTWIFDGGQVPSRFVSIKPRVENSSTDVHIISDHGNEYSFSLRGNTAYGRTVTTAGSARPLRLTFAASMKARSRGC